MAIVVLLLQCCVSPSFASGEATPYVPANEATVLEHLPSTSDPRVRRFDALRLRAQARPRDVAAAVALSRAYLDYGRDTGDARYLGRAEAIIAPWARKQPPADDALLVEATIFQSRHQFVEARRILEGLVAHDPGNAQAWLTLSSVALVQGDMELGRKACTRLVRSADVLVTAGCIGSWAMVNGRARSALDGVDRLLQQEPDASAGLQSWAHGLLGDASKYLSLQARADAEFKRALELAPGDNFLLADYADFLLDSGRPREALALTRDYSQSDTSFLRQVLAETALGLPEAKRHVATMAARFRDLEQRGDSRLYGREESRFALQLQHDPARALRLAQSNWSIQRAPEDIRIFLEAALAAGQPAAARDVVEFAKRTGFEEARVRSLVAKVEASLDQAPAGAPVRP